MITFEQLSELVDRNLNITMAQHQAVQLQSQTYSHTSHPISNSNERRATIVPPDTHQALQLHSQTYSHTSMPISGDRRTAAGVMPTGPEHQAVQLQSQTYSHTSHPISGGGGDDRRATIVPPDSHQALQLHPHSYSQQHSPMPMNNERRATIVPINQPRKKIC